jgi:multiple sugar transport system substrate-binding protein
MSMRHVSAAHQLTRRRLLRDILASTGALALLSACGSTVTATATTAVGTATQSAGSPTTTASSETTARVAVTQSTVATTASGAVPQPASAAPTRAGNAVAFWTCAQYPYKGQIGAKFVAEFEQLGGPTIQYQDTIYKDLMTKLVTTVAAGTPPDLSYVDAYIVPTYACSTAVISMSDMIARSKVIKPDMFWPAMIDYGIEKGKVYGIPHGPDVGLLYYNKDAFNSAGLDPEKPPTTWDDALTAVQRLTRSQGGTLQQVGWAPLESWNGPAMWEIPYWQLGGTMFSTDQTTPAFDNDHALQALDWLKKVYDVQGGRDAVTKFVSAAKGGVKAFVGGQMAMLFEPHATSVLSINGKANFSWATSYWPVAPAGKQASMIDGWNLVIPKGAKQAPGAFAFLEFLCTTDPQIRWANTWYNEPAVIAAAQMPAFLNANPLNKLEVDLSPASKTWISAVGAKNLDAIENTMVADVLTGKQTPHDALSSASASMQAAMTEAQKSCAL